MRIALRLSNDMQGRATGTARQVDSPDSAAVAFSGHLELLALLEQLADPQWQGRSPPLPGPFSRDGDEQHRHDHGVRIELDLSLDPDGRLTGRSRRAGAAPDEVLDFCGSLELLARLEQLVLPPRSAKRFPPQTSRREHLP